MSKKRVPEEVNGSAVMREVMRWRSKRGLSLSTVDDYVKTRSNPCRKRFGNIGDQLEAALKGKA